MSRHLMLLAAVLAACSDDPDAGQITEPAEPIPDAGPGDGPPPEVGPIDVGPPDAGASDAEASDAGPDFAEPSDAGAEDTGPADAGPPDAGPELDAPDGMVAAPAGAFWMGCNDDQCNDDEHPQHVVSTAAFAVDRAEVSNALFAGFMEAHGNDCDGFACMDCEDGDAQIDCATWLPRPDCKIAGGVESCADHPAVEITWYGAKAYCEWSGGRLPTEAEWEKAARGGCAVQGCADEDATCCAAAMPKYPWGDTPVSCDTATMYTDSAGCGTGGTLPVDSLPAGASPYGALHMVGNVWEWVQDCWHDTYQDAPADGGAWEDGCSSAFRVARGASYYHDAPFMRAGVRTSADPGKTYFHFGVRCARTLP